MRALQVFAAGSLILGYLLTGSYFPGHMGREYAVLSLVSAAAAIPLVASAMRSSSVQILRAMVLVVFFLGYYVQFYWMILDPNVGQDLPDAMVETLLPGAMLATFRAMTWTFVGLAVLCFLTDRIPDRRKAPPETGPVASLWIGWRAVVAGGVLLAGILPVMAVQGIGLMAAEAPDLPFRLGGWMVYGLRIFVPGLFLLAVAMGEIAGESRLTRAGVIGLFVAGAGDMLVTTSKSSLVLAVVRLLVLLALTGGLTRRRLQVGGVVLVVLALLFPFFSALRTARVLGFGGAEAVRAASSDKERFDESVFDQVRPAVLRISGADTLLPLVEMEPIPVVALAGFVSPIGISSFITVAVYGFPPDAPMAAAPGLIGWFHLALGSTLVVPGVLAFLLLLELAWRAAWRVPLISRDVVVALLAAFFLTVITDGVVESIGLPLLVIAATTVGLEVLARLGVRSVARGLAVSEPPRGG